MPYEYEDILAIIDFIRESMSKYGNPVGLTGDELSAWSGNLDLKRKGETVFYAGMYTYMGYAETALMLEYFLKNKGMRVSDLLKWVDKASKLGYEKNMKGIVRLLSSPLSLLGRLIGISGDLLSSLRDIARSVDERSKVYYAKLVKGVKLLRDSGIDFAYLGSDEPDSGVALHTFGLLEDFRRHAENVYSRLKSYGVKRIITMDPISGAALKFHYPKFVDGFDIEVKHITHVLQPKAARSEYIGSLVYHDPCPLVRYWKTINEPRNLLAAIGFKVIDPPNSREKTRCDGGAIEYQDPIGSMMQARIRLNELLSTGQNKVVTSCPVCIMLFRIGSYISSLNVEVYDIVDLIS
ncbi:MAG: (Fe-S)-binding protein [Candidatus Methanomethylicia archaeon]